MQRKYKSFLSLLWWWGVQGIQDLCGCSHALVRVVKAEGGVRPQDVGEGLGVQCGQKAGARAV